MEPEEAESEIDDYAIPDESESYASNRTVKAANSHEDAHEESNEAYVSAYGMTPQEAADEDRMVTQAEYGAEIEAETTEKDPSELQYITPIDYAKRIAYMLSIYEPDITDELEKLKNRSNDSSEQIPVETIAQLKRTALTKELEGLIFLNPDRYNENNPDIGWETADEYLSGNVRDKLRVAKAMAADTDNPQAERFAGNVAALEKVQPEWIEASDIDVKIGTTWIESLDYEQFIYELLNTPRRARAVRSQFYNTGIQVHLNKMSIQLK